MAPRPGQLVAVHDTPHGSVQIRYPHSEDAPAMLEYINVLSAERTFITLQGEQFDLEEEEEILFSRLEGFALGRSVTLLAVHGSRVVGITQIDRHARVEEHVAGFGISVAQDFRGCGLGDALLRSVIEESIKFIQGMRLIELAVYSANEAGIRLYRKHGFKQHGVLREAIHYKGTYLDKVLMVKHLVPPKRRPRKKPQVAAETPGIVLEKSR
jgi:putative acetyltransferase